MGFSTKVQQIKRAKSEQWYLTLPSAIAHAMEFSKGEELQWFIDDKETIVIERPNSPPRRRKKNAQAPQS